MLKLISLWTLDRIFDRAKTPLSARAKMIYINCLMFHFDKLEPTTENSVGFEIFDTELDYEKFEKLFVELHKAGFVIIKEKSIYFENHWGQFIDRSQLSKTSDSYVNASLQNDIDCYKDSLGASKELEAHIRKNHSVSEPKYRSLLTEFIEEQKATGHTYNSYKDASSHFYYWIAKKKTNTPEKGKSSQILGM